MSTEKLNAEKTKALDLVLEVTLEVESSKSMARNLPVKLQLPCI